MRPPLFCPEDSFVRTHLRFVIFASMLLCVAAVASDAPRVTKVDPPNWWTRFTPEVMLLLSGQNLSQASVSTSSPGITVTRTQPGASDHYLFVWLTVNSSAAAGPVSLQVRSSSGGTEIKFPLLSRDADFVPAGISSDDVIYLIMPDRFADGDPNNDRPAKSTGIYDRTQPKAYHGGDLKGIEDHLAYLRDLGVTAVWLTPVWKNTDSDYHGYHVVDFYAVDDHMGSMKDYQHLVDAAHKLGLKVLIDYVVNHTGPNHPWASDPPAADWFHGTPEHHLAAQYNFNGLVDPHASPRAYRAVLEGWFVDKLPDLNPDNPLLEKYLTQNALWWTAIAKLDGFRLDTFPYSSRRSWSEWHKGVREVFPDLYSLGEVADSNPEITSFFQGGRTQFDGIDSGVTTVFDFPLNTAIREVLDHNAPVQRLIDTLRQDALYPHPEKLVTFVGNHDDTRMLRDAGGSKEKLEAAFSLLLTLRGVPEIYAGDEIAMDGGEDPDNRRDFPGGFPADAHNAFTPAGRTPEQQEVFSLVQKLLRLRKEHPALRQGAQTNIGWDNNSFAFVRETANDRMLVVLNNQAQGQQAITIPIEDTVLQNAKTLSCVLGPGQADIQGNTLQVNAPAESVTICEVR